MPHIDSPSKRVLNSLGRALCWARSPGEKVYQAYMQLVDSLPPEPRFADFFAARQFADMMAATAPSADATAWRMAWDEFKRLRLDPYEDQAITRNGRAEWPPMQPEANLPKRAATAAKHSRFGRRGRK